VRNAESNVNNLDEMARLAKDYSKLIEEEGKQGEKQVKIKNTGKRNPKRHLELKIDELLNDNLGSLLGRMVATKAF
jgi:26S proteasome regulatory subunit N11